ncbi:MAG: S41 family peptidase [Ekhidna sp.]
MKLIKNMWVWMMLLISIAVACNKDDGINVPLQNEANEFVWRAMNIYYYWVSEVEDLSTDKYPTYDALYTFLNEYAEPEDLFERLLFEGDRFSWIVDDYEALEQSFQGVSKSFGFKLGLIRIAEGSDDLMGYVRYVVPGSPAEVAGLKRGDLFTKADGQQLTLNNYISLLNESEQVTLALSQILDNEISTTGVEISLVAVELTENPILFSDILEVDGVRVGYLVYNQFVNNGVYHNEMNSIFGRFKTEGINDLVLDLRYNRGGSVDTSVILASLIYGNGSARTVFTATKYNEQLEAALIRAGLDPNEYFTDDIPNTSSQLNRLDLGRVFILTSGSTASASELIISGLDPYMDITLIGTATVGKNLGSTTLYDSPNFRKTPDNSGVNHTKSNYAIQPIISRFTNINDIDYKDGFEPNIQVNEVDYVNEGLKPLGDPGEALLAEALAIITGTARVARPPASKMKAVPDYDIDAVQNSILMDDPELALVVGDQLYMRNQ